MSIEALLKDLNIDPKYVDPSVVKSLNMVTELIKTPEFSVGQFLSRILNRFFLIDAFRFDGIACIGYSPTTRQITLSINPFLLWHGLLRTILIKEGCQTKYIERCDAILMQSLKNGGWTPELFIIGCEVIK